MFTQHQFDFGIILIGMTISTFIKEKVGQWFWAVSISNVVPLVDLYGVMYWLDEDGEEWHISFSHGFLKLPIIFVYIKDFSHQHHHHIIRGLCVVPLFLPNCEKSWWMSKSEKPLPFGGTSYDHLTRQVLSTLKSTYTEIIYLL